MSDTLPTAQQITDIINNLTIPFTDATIGTLKALKQCTIDSNGKATIMIVLGLPADYIRDRLIQQIMAAIHQLNAAITLDIDISSKISPRQIQPGLSRIPTVKNIIAIASGKGGVGKSTTAVNIALALKQQGTQVGVLDADVHGPSVPHMLGIDTSKVEHLDEHHIEPIYAHDMPVMSMGLMVDKETAMIWRGPMASQVFEKMLRETTWGALDYLVVDMPPGTGDIQITLAQKTPITGVVLVTTPQTVALDDARRSLNMFQKVQVPVLGIIENMSSFCCPQCETESSLFGPKSIHTIQQQYDIDLLGNLPIDPSIGRQTDAGVPIVAAEPQSLTADRYMQIAVKIAGNLAKRQIDHSSKFPKIVIEK